MQPIEFYGRHHHHHHHHHSELSDSTSQRFIWAIIINILYVTLEFFLGFRYGSAGLLADAGHNLSDIGGLVISLTAFFLQKKQPNDIFTYGLKKATILAAFLNSLILFGAIAMIFYESMEKFICGSSASGWAIILTAASGVAVNAVTVTLLAEGSKNDLNIKSAYLHMFADTLLSLAVAVSGGLILLTDWRWLDPLAGVIIAVIILANNWTLFRESLILLLDGVPSEINLPQFRQQLMATGKVRVIDRLHIRAVSTTENELQLKLKLVDPADAAVLHETIRQYASANRITNTVIAME